MSKPSSFDVAVIGAGPAGCTAALELAQHGYSVVLLEKSALPRYKTCGGGVLARAFKMLPPGADAIVEAEFKSVALHFLRSRQSFTATRAEPLVRMTMRADLDRWLSQTAKRAGAHIVESSPVKRVELRGDVVEVFSEREIFRAKFVIAADGVHSVTAKLAGWPDLPALAPALEYEIHLPSEEFARFSAVPRFDFDTIDSGYAWIFPKRAHLSAGILSTRRVCPDLAGKLMAYLQRLGITRIEKMERHGWLIPLAPRPGPLACGRVLLVGDAAGLVDPVTAEGISHALLSGQLAAQALVEAKLDVKRVAPLYQSLLQENILKELRAARFLAKVLYRQPRLRDMIFRLNGQRLCEFVAEAVSGRHSYRDALRRPSSYFRLLGF